MVDGWDFIQSTQRRSLVKFSHPPTTAINLMNFYDVFVNFSTTFLFHNTLCVCVYLCVYLHNTNKEDSNSAIYKIMNNFIIFWTSRFIFCGNFGGRNCRSCFDKGETRGGGGGGRVKL